MFKFTTMKLFVKNRINHKILKSILTLNYYKLKEPKVALNSKINFLSLWVLRLARRYEDLPKPQRRGPAFAVRKLRRRSLLNRHTVSNMILETWTDWNKFNTVITRCVSQWDRVPFSFKTTKSLTFYKGRKTFRKEIYMTFKNFTNLLFTLRKLIYSNKFKPKKHLLNYFLYKKKKLNVMDTVDSLVFKSIQKKKNVNN